ncbi:amino acid/amide ABC transporter ATP-binding protein 1, HAAT family (TC 3.A.1.4.-) [Stackebrandtia albiflava]|uniref:Amino acid/amide ABC transporter ATP-binding protein 1, HAAT family (TC 3.A.1.4.-) n=1 Tax=Stackebrandtia albiflava TaxID=406432 RepID=A0A562V3S0_9ACTN|nr:ABC transporter ATP-binding protein [Stackebrandtia albiflava]TWJ12526.1 amino acid/amide ABC transporter ATP-binding protein 1, HAAT family (TC 3.A.1.4.-) [Stackebrandtia albiflava]
MTDLLTITGLRRDFGSLRAVDGFDLTLAEGDRHALIGCNGAGKSTVLHMVAGAVRPTGGRIAFAGTDVTRKPAHRRSRLGIARTFQTPAPLDSFTCLENLTLAARPHDATSRWRPSRRRAALAERATAQLAALNLADRADTPASALSHGQRRLLEIAMALMAGPRLLLLDEPAAGLTDADMARLLECLGSLPAELTVLLVEHHQDVVTAIADTVTVLHNGRTLTSGTPAEIAADPQVAEVYLGTAA